MQNISKFLISLPSRIFCQTSSARFQDINRCFSCRCCSKSRLQVGNIHRAMFCVFLHFFRSVLVRNSAISSLDHHGRHFYFFFFSSLVNIRTASRSAAPGNEVDRCLVSNQIYHRIYGILLAASKYGQRRLVMKN